MWDFFGGLLTSALTWVGQTLVALFGPVIDLLTGFVYFLGLAIDTVIKVVQILLYLVQVLAAFGGGLVRTFVELAAFNTATIAAETNPFDSGASLLFGFWSDLGGDVIAGVLSWGVWIGLAAGVVWLIGRR